MELRARVGLYGAGLIACGWLLGGAFAAYAADTASLQVTNKPGDEAVPLIVPGFQEAQDLAQQAIEQTRREAEAAIKRNADAVAARLGQLEQSLELQHKRELETLQSSNRTTLIVAGALAGTGFLGMLCLAFFLMRATNRLTELTMTVPLSQALGPGYLPHALTAGDSHAATANPAEQAGARFLGAIEQLERRLHELEHTPSHPAPVTASSYTNGKPKADAGGSVEKPDYSKPVASALPSQNEIHHATPPAPVGDDAASRVALLLAKGQTLLSMEQPDEALACFDDAIVLDARNTEALVKKGAALEKLRRVDEAIECYDRAIELDGTMTTAYLHKGGVFNRLERYDEALRCYEQALKLERKTPAS